MAIQTKICGLTTPAAVETAISGGASHIGYIFFAKSPRNISPDDAATLADLARDKVIQTVVTVNADDAFLGEIVKKVRPDMLQLHGSESPERIREIKDRFNLPVMKAFSISGPQDLENTKAYEGVADQFLFDAKPPKETDLPGGNGISFDWNLLRDFTSATPYMLSGGLDADNVEEAISRSGAKAIDISSGVESAPGIKDIAKIETLLKIVSDLQFEGKTQVTNSPEPNSFKTGPDEAGHFGIFGGRYVAETLMPLILELEQAYKEAKQDPEFIAELEYLNTHYTGRPSPLYFAERMTEHLGGAKIYFKRDELNHTGSHKINNCLGQILLARRMGKTRIIAETGAGQHGVAAATVSARFDFPCKVYMGATDVERQSPNVFRMRLLGAEIEPVTAGAGTLKDAMNEALRDWVTNVKDTYYLIGTAAGPHPYPELVRDFQSVIGKEVRQQMMAAEGRLPDMLIACVGGGSNAIGLFHPFLDDKEIQIVGVEAGGKGLDGDEHCASLTAGSPGVLHGNRTYLLQDDDGQILEGHSISAGLDYPGIGPEHSWLKETNRVEYVPATDTEALEAFQLLCRLEGIIPALEPSHALAEVMKRAPTMGKDQIIVMNLCGRGDKDVFTVGKALGFEF